MEVPEEVKRAIGQFVRPLAAMRSGARWVRTEGLHVTLKFIGEAQADQCEKIKAALGAVTSSAPVQLTFRGTGFFPSARNPRVFWAGIDSTPNLAEITAGIESRLGPLGIAPEERAFKPHLTLARFKTEGGLADLRAAIDSAGAVDFGGCTAGEFHLFESKLRPGGAEYAKLATFNFTTARGGG